MLAGGQGSIPTLDLRLAEADRRGMPDLCWRPGDHGSIGVAVHAWVVATRPATPERILHALGKVN